MWFLIATDAQIYFFSHRCTDGFLFAKDAQMWFLIATDAQIYFFSHRCTDGFLFAKDAKMGFFSHRCKDGFLFATDAQMGFFLPKMHRCGFFLPQMHRYGFFATDAQMGFFDILPPICRSVLSVHLWQYIYLYICGNCFICASVAINLASVAIINLQICLKKINHLFICLVNIRLFVVHINVCDLLLQIIL